MDLFFPHRLKQRNFLVSESFDCFDGFGHGRFQQRLFLVCTLSVFVVSSHSYLPSLTAGDVDHWCKQPPHSNISALAWKNGAIPLEADGRLSRCRRYENIEEPNNSQTIPCEDWEYDEDQARVSMRSTWNLVCDRYVLLQTAVIAERVSSVVFGVASGCLADRFGRMLVLFAAVAILLASTVSSFFAPSYQSYALARFFAQGSAVATYIVTGIVFFEVTTHENRPIHIVITGALASVLADSWLAIMWEAKLPWQAEQAFFVAPTFLLLATFFTVRESPRWLIAKARFKKAEYVMLAAAKLNKFPLPNTACLMQELRVQQDQVADNAVHQTEQLLSGVSIRKRAFATFALSFSLVYALRTVISLTVMRKIPLVRWTAPAATALCFPAMVLLLRRVTMRTFITTCFTLLGVVMCLLGLLLVNLPAISDVLLVTAKALSAPANIVFTVYTLELFPTAVRGTAAGWIFGCGASGALCATVSLTLLSRNRTDVVLAMGGFFLFASTLAQLPLPENTTVECTKMVKKRKSVAARKNLQHMKRTLSPIRSPTKSKSNSPQDRKNPRRVKKPEHSP
ncbi:hypothetical protein HPB48_027066 [Haemaphysalis longicornis]|uniref:Uncharacterized protein n=1 Tax=Haemaphysalis longicornis TaxID=44386 RepID=A0A9J6HB12_HAELO|nr:hypothetical protein HPB48_027066 [Haemaphysalis longicornis]